MCAPLDGQARFQGRQTDRTSRVGRETESSKNVAAVQSVVGVVVVVADCGTKVQPWGGEQAKRGGTLFQGHSGDFGNGAKFVWKMSKSVMQLISIRF